MAQATFSIRMDETLKKQFDSLCSDFGMNATTAFNIFAKAVVRERRIPFEISSPSNTIRDDAISAFWEMRKIAEENGLQDMTMHYLQTESKDLVFYEVCLSKRNDDSMLVTGNMKHFPARPFIVTPNELLSIIQRGRP